MSDRWQQMVKELEAYEAAFFAKRGNVVFRITPVGETPTPYEPADVDGACDAGLLEERKLISDSVGSSSSEDVYGLTQRARKGANARWEPKLASE